jgi:hypothetical protein
VHDVPEAADYLQVHAALRGHDVVQDDLRLDPGLRREPAA